MKIVSDPSDIEHSWHKLYERLSDRVVSLLPARGEIVEVGCGKGPSGIMGREAIVLAT